MLNWQGVDGAEAYEILRDGVVVTTDDGRWYTDLGLDPGTTYEYQIRAVAADGTVGDLSSAITVTTNP